MNAGDGDCVEKEKDEASRLKNIILPFVDNLQKSKSLSVRDIFKFVEPETLMKPFTMFNLFPDQFRNLIRQAIERKSNFPFSCTLVCIIIRRDHFPDPAQMADGGKEALGRFLVDMAAEAKELASVIAELSVIIIDVSSV